MRVINSLLVIAILLFATVIGWTYFAVRGEQQATDPLVGIGGGPDTNQTTDTNFRKSFYTLLPEHGNVAVVHLSNLYDGKDTTDTSRRLDENAQKLAEVIKQLGTTTDKALFLRTFRGHIREYENYTEARKNNDQSAINAAKENLEMHAMEFGELTHKLMPSISKQRATELMSEHVKLTLAIVDAHAKGDTAKKLTEIKNANTQAIRFAEELTQGAEKAQN